MKPDIPLLCLMLLVVLPLPLSAARAPVSEATEECLRCHSSLHPGIVEGWSRSRHAMTTPKAASEVRGTARKISATAVPEPVRYTAVGCAECHTLSPEKHPDTVSHNGFPVHPVVTPRNCAVCHPVEAEEFSGNIMAHARKNLAANPLYLDLQRNTIGQAIREEGHLRFRPAEPETQEGACFHCHGTQVTVKGTQTRETVMGEMEFPVLAGWPNRGVGRVNPDGSQGACSACHTRHNFSIETARKPDTCRECHVGPDVPAYKVYMSSKHGALYASENRAWNFQSVPWRIGRDFRTPTCAACHISLLTNTDGETVVKRTHRMNDRLPWRIFGLVYAHPHPLDPDTSKIRNRDGLPLPTNLDGGTASAFLIDPAEQDRRTKNMQAVCLNCHSAEWVQGHWRRFEHSVQETNASVLAATRIMRDIWSQGFAGGLNRDESIFDESVERTWCDIWLFYANTTRFAAAMAGGGDYGVFADGRYQINRRTQELQEWLDLRLRLLPAAAPVAALENPLTDAARLYAVHEKEVRLP